MSEKAVLPYAARYFMQKLFTYMYVHNVDDFPNLWDHECTKLIKYTFGCKVIQYNPIAMKHTVYVSFHQPNIYTGFPINI